MKDILTSSPPFIAPSMLSCDFGNMQKDIEMINNSLADLFHIDIMDGLFVPNLSFGFPVLKKIQKHAKKPLDVHLMIVDPDRYVERFREHGSEIITVHYEACTHLHRTVQLIHSTGARAGVSLNPHTPVELLEDIIQDLDLVLVMSVNPGYGGQKFIPQSLDKIKRLKRLISSGGSKAMIEVDGGVTLDNARDLIDAGAEILVAGNTVFGSKNPESTIAHLKNIINQ
jgi:ribulose-phosphate 3-epimerase